MIACFLLTSCDSANSRGPNPENTISKPRLRGGEEFVERFGEDSTSLWSISDGWDNGPAWVNDWRKSQVDLVPDLRITLERGADRKFSSGEIQSRPTYGHGYYEARMRAASGSGVVNGFFTYTGPPFGNPWNEIDIEILGSEPTKLYATYFYGDKKDSKIIELGFDATEAKHTYAFDWQPEWIRWYVDGELVHETAGENIPLPDKRQKVMVHLWASETLTDWVGTFDPTALPTTMTIDCVAYSVEKPVREQCR